MYTRIGSFDFAIKPKITPQNLMPGFGTIYRATLLNAYSLFKVYKLMFLAKIKGNKVHFWKLVTFFWEGGVYLPLPTP